MRDSVQRLAETLGRAIVKRIPDRTSEIIVRCVFLAIGMGLCALALFFARDLRFGTATTVQVQGKVVRLEQTSLTYGAGEVAAFRDPVIRFLAEDGPHELVGIGESLKVGDTVTVSFPPGAPDQARIHQPDVARLDENRFIGTLICCILGLAFIGVFLLTGSSWWTGPSPAPEGTSAP